MALYRTSPPPPPKNPDCGGEIRLFFFSIAKVEVLAPFSEGGGDIFSPSEGLLFKSPPNPSFSKPNLLPRLEPPPWRNRQGPLPFSLSLLGVRGKIELPL